MKKEDYMKLTKERLAELLAERDSQPVIPQPVLPTIIGNGHLPCFEGGQCTNPFHDCINCPRQGSTGEWLAYTTTNLKYKAMKGE